MAPTLTSDSSLTARGLASVLLKVLGVYWLMSGVLQVPNVLALRAARGEPYGGLPDAEEIYVSQLLVLLLMLSAGLVLMVGTRLVLKALRVGDEPGEPLGASNGLTVGLSLLGAWLVSTALPALASVPVALMVLSKGSGGTAERQEYLGASWDGIAATVFQVAIGLWLFLGARGITAAWQVARNGTKSRAGDG